MSATPSGAVISAGIPVEAGQLPSATARRMRGGAATRSEERERANYTPGVVPH
jgi:hypothetical protein